jgi:hypothetical protein
MILLYQIRLENLSLDIGCHQNRCSPRMSSTLDDNSFSRQEKTNDNIDERYLPRRKNFADVFSDSFRCRRRRAMHARISFLQFHYFWTPKRGILIEILTSSHPTYLFTLYTTFLSRSCVEADGSDCGVVVLRVGANLSSLPEYVHFLAFVREIRCPHACFL